MATRKSISFGYDKPYFIFTYGSTFNSLVLSPHKVFTLDFQSGVPQKFIETVVHILKECKNPKTDKLFFTKVHISERPQTCSREETEKLAETETMLKALQEQRDMVSDRILIVGSEDFYKQRLMKFNAPQTPLEHTSHLKGVFVTISEPIKDQNLPQIIGSDYKLKFMHHLEKTVLDNKTRLAINPSAHVKPHHKARSIASDIIGIYSRQLF